MSALDQYQSIRQLLARTNSFRTGLVRVVFGDTTGVALFLTSICFFMFYWRIGVFITDTNGMLNTLVNVADGHLHFEIAPYGDGRQEPGAYSGPDGRVYGRNYGIIFATLPVLWLVQGIGTVVDPRIGIVAVWSILVVALTLTVGRQLGRQWIGTVGSVVAFGVFLGNSLVATPLPSGSFEIIALQVVTMIAAALTGVFLYRLVARMYGTTIGLFAGCGAVLATPIAFWASLPKRHSFTVALIAMTAYTLYLSRATDSKRWVTYRALAYVPVGLLAWIHAAEAFFVFMPLALVDVATARSNDRRTLGIVAGTFFLSLLPFFLTNILVSGNPIKPPRLLPAYGQTESVVSASSSGGFADIFGDGPVGSAVSRGLSTALLFVSLLQEGAVVMATDPDRLYHTFVRSGFLPSVASEEDFEALSLTVIESAPILGALAGLPVAFVTFLYTHGSHGVSRLRSHIQTPIGTVDAFVAITSVIITLLFIPRLPANAQVTIRYLHPLYLFGMYALVRMSIIRDTLDTNWQMTIWTYIGGVLVGGQLLVITLFGIDPGLGEAVQFHALLAITIAGLLAIWILTAELSDRIPSTSTSSLGAITLGLAAATGTLFVLLSGLDYFDYAGEYALPLVRLLTDALAIV